MASLSSASYSSIFQGEDGIRDIGVTGVQTCALPISRTSARSRSGGRSPDWRRRRPPSVRPSRRSRGSRRSEERRVGKGVDLGGRRIIKKQEDKQVNTNQLYAKNATPTFRYHFYT